jgi:hypothetical protein
LNFEQSRPLGVRRITSKPKSVLNPKFDLTTQDIRQATPSVGERRRRRRAPFIGPQSLFRAEVGQIDKSMQTADIHE